MIVEDSNFKSENRRGIPVSVSEKGTASGYFFSNYRQS